MSYVPPSGPLDARIVIVGEAPGVEEEQRGEPFVGPSGHLLNQMLASAGIDRARCYITNVCKTRPPRNDFTTLYNDGKKRREPSPTLLASREALYAELRSIKPNVIVPLGDEALRAVANRSGITKWRGSILSTPFGKAVPTLHPAYILRQYESRTIAELDLKRVAAESTSPVAELPIPRFVLKPSLDAIIAWLRAPHQRIAYDIETLGPHVRCLGFASSALDAICIPFISHRALSDGPRIFLDCDHVNTANSHWSEDEEWVLLQELDKFFRRTDVEFVGQNVPFDNEVLWREFGIGPHHVVIDTMLAQHCCYAELPKGLDFLASVYTRIPYYSDYDPSVDLETWRYNCWDCVATWEVARVLEREMVDLGVTEFYRNHLNECLPALQFTQSWGVKIDTAAREAKALETEREIESLARTIRIEAGEPDLNPNSDKQIKDLLYGKLKLPPILHHQTKQPTTNKDAIETLTKRYPQHEKLLVPLRRYSELSTLLSGFLRKELHNGRIYTNYNLAGTVTGRLSSAEPLFRPGTNLQNIPVRTESGKTFRRLFLADEGYTLIKADLSQAEFRLVVWLGRVARIIERYLHDPDFDVHRWVASLIYRKPESDVTKDERAVAKNGVYGGNYKMYYTTAARTYKLPLNTAKFVLEEYRKAIPEIPRWWDEVQEELNRTSMSRSPLGRLRIFFGRHDDDMLRAALSHKAQCIVGDLIDRALALAVECFDPSLCRVVMQIHDELVFMCRSDLVDQYVPRIRSLMEYPIRFPGVDVPLVIPADIGVGPNWLDTSKVKGA